jgi:hypothetical protein
MPHQRQTPFDSIEGAREYVSLLAESLEEAASSIQEDTVAAERTKGAERRVEALRLVEYKLNQLREHLSASRRILNDLRTLRRLLLKEGDDAQD